MQIDGRTRLYGILGNPVAHSLSPALHNRVFEHHRINAAYVPLPVTDLKRSRLDHLFASNFHGFSVTIPFKSQAARLADTSDALTTLSGAANTLIPQGDKISAINTDGPGGLRALGESLRNPEGLTYLVVGYGGSAAGIAHALLLEKWPGRLLFCGRNLSRARRLAQKLKELHNPERTLIVALPEQKINPAEVDVIINTTPLGMEGMNSALPIAEDFLLKKHTVFDIVYKPLRTPLIAAAGRSGARTVPGYTMLLYQAVLQSELFTGRKAPVSLMEKILLKSLKL
ncbi:MAG: shikimate dehydrogenase [Spirochaetales bacterium]|nr:shikimate dehydrogenase [Spirochaetales bacterium]